MEGERNDLLGRAERGYGAISPGEANGAAEVDLLPLAESVVAWAKLPRGDQSVLVSIPQESYLATLLYARYTINSSIVQEGKFIGPTRQKVSRKRALERERTDIEVEVERFLNEGIRYLDARAETTDDLIPPAGQMSADEGTGSGQNLDEVDPEAEEAVEILLWTRWTFGTGRLSGELCR